MSDEVSRDDDNAPKPEEKKTGFWKRMFTGVDADELNETGAEPESQATHPGEPRTEPPPPAAPQPETPPVTPAPQAENQAQTADDGDEGGNFWTRMKQGLGKTRKGLGKGLADLLVGAKEIDDEIFEEIETQLLVADVGVEATDVIIEALTGQVSREELVDADALYESLQNELRKLLVPVDQPLNIDGSKKPYVILMVGVNGVGKTTTIAKMGRYLQSRGLSVMFAAGDTFRAAAVEQLKTWGERLDIPVVAQGQGADPASVVFDAYAAARARGVDVLIADTAGRLHTQTGLMAELGKIRRVLGKQHADAPHETVLVLDATMGQNA
uniref:signal recognition particle-docking protein FtsY n=1 Tax=Alcanivorax sp. TaxID=1872427 RepID=UPI0026097A9D